MKVSKLFHWLYASVMFIPLLIAPIFGLAVRSDNNFQPIEVQAQDYEVVDFNQKMQLNSDHYRYYSQINNNSVEWNNVYVNSGNSFIFYYDLVLGHKYYLKNNVTQFIAYEDEENSIDVTANHYPRLYFNGTSSGHNYLYEGIFTATDSQIYLNFSSTNKYSYIYMTSQTNIFDLTQMFGEGNEPTIEQFNIWYSNNYYQYTNSRKELLNIGTTTYNDTDVGSQMVYTLYNATDKYFNFNQFLGIGNLFNWFQINVFNGNAPLGFIIFWNLLIYWLLVSIAWLIFDIAMFVPKLAHRWLDKGSLE